MQIHLRRICTRFYTSKCCPCSRWAKVGNCFRQDNSPAEYENETGTSVNNNCLVSVENLPERIKVDIAINLEERAIERDQELAEVKNHIRHLNEDSAPLSINAQENMLEDISVSD